MQRMLCETSWVLPPVPDDLPEPVINDPEWPLISIVTPSFNQGAFVGQTIGSILAQEYPNIEYWVIDGDSSDQTKEVLAQVNDPRFHWLSEADDGQSDAINKGLVRCHGELFTWVNSDDMLAPGALKAFAAVWRTLPQASLIYGLMRLIDASGVDIGYFPSHSPNITRDQLLRLWDILPQPATMIPMERLRAVNGVNPALHFAMDLDLWIRLDLPMVHHPEVLAYFREHPSSKSVAQTPSFIKEVEQILQCAVLDGLISKAEAQAHFQIFAGNTYLLPQHYDRPQALSHFRLALGQSPGLLPQILSSLAKDLIRRSERKGKRSILRDLHAHLRQLGLRL
ncbi:MAG: glycosyltransferase [Chloroflexi bacterium]|nr:glycosyltransferase [Chloroflexota bacterium]